MEFLLSIWPTLGDGYEHFPRRASWRKSGPGRRHNRLTKKQQQIKDNTGVDVTRL